MLAGHLPFASSTKLATIVDDDENPSLQKLIPSKKPFLFSKNMRLDARTLISSMLRVNPLDRADLEEVVCHRWMCDERELTTDTPLPG
jgi:serine/threonine protein kinase